MASISFTAIGGGGEIGANSYLLRANGYDVLLDCGIHPKKEGRCALPDFSLLMRAPHAVVISHGHMDHCGALPYLLRQFPGIECYATRPTVFVMDRMLHNSVAVMRALALERGVREYPLYDHDDVDYALQSTYGLALGRDFAVTSDEAVRAIFHHAGHVLGSAGVLLRFPGHTVFYTGDVCVSDQELVGGLDPFDPGVGGVDTLIIEATRGAHPDAAEKPLDAEIERFTRETGKVLSRGGCVLVPSFALGRSQEVLNIVSRLQRSGKLPAAPVYTSGMGRAIYEVYSRFPEYLRPNADLRPLHEFKRIGDVWDRRVIRDLLSVPSIIVATSGMMIENTPSAIIAGEMVRHKKHGIFFVGYLDPETLGYKALHAKAGDRLCFELDGPPVRIKLENRQAFTFSAHASREDLCELVRRISPRTVIFIHGDPDAIAWMCANCDSGFRTVGPSLGETVCLEE